MSKDLPPEGERGGFFQRWSKRKLEDKPVQATPPATLPAEQPAAEEEPFDISTLPTLEDITGDSDLSMFLQKGVPQALKNAAMRRVWALDPQISAISGPLDYAWDFNDPNGVPGFGPLAADFDPSAMLKRIMGESDPEPDAENVQNTLAEGETMEGDEIAGSSPDPAKVAYDAQTDLVAMQNSAPSIMPADRQSSEKRDLNQEIIDERAGAESAAPARSEIAFPRKRHGGAVPI